MKPTQLIDLFQRAPADKSMVIIEGVQALKHALRFQAEITHIATCAPKQLQHLLSLLAPDVAAQVAATITEVSEDVFRRISPKNHRTKVVALAARAGYDIAHLTPEKPIVFLENPRDLENIGAVIRVAAAANVAAVVADSESDIWHPAIVRGAAGLHWALPVCNASLEAIRGNRTIYALDPTGDDIYDHQIASNAILIFGTEREGIRQETLKQADYIIRLPMQQGVSSLNLATSVAATLYGSRIVDR